MFDLVVLYFVLSLMTVTGIYLSITKEEYYKKSDYYFDD